MKQAIDLSEQLKIFLGDFDALSSRIKHLHFDTKICGNRIDLRCSYISFRDGEQTFDDFISVLAEHIIPFSLPRKSIDDVHAKVSTAIENGDTIKVSRYMTNLQEQARALFMKARKGTHRSGEAGEILLYILTEWLLKAPQVVSKMYLKTNNNMPVHGTDGIHARYDESQNMLHLYWGESKAHQTLGSAFSDAIKSISGFLAGDQQDFEITVVNNHSDFNAVSPAAREAFISFLDPYSPTSNNRIIYFSCLLVFNFPSQNKLSEYSEEEFVAAVNSKIEKFINNLKKQISDKGLKKTRFEFFLVPVPSVKDFRDKFQAKIGWPND